MTDREALIAEIGDAIVDCENDRARRYTTILKKCRAMLAADGEASRLHQELLYAVARKFPGESRHETALRYIRQAENPGGAHLQGAGASSKPTDAQADE